MNIDNKDPILITGAAGFIGAALSIKLLNHGLRIIGVDNLNSYYDKNLKLNRLKNIERNSSNFRNWNFENISITNRNKLKEIFYSYKPRVVINLAAQAGVRYSLKNPQEYINTNLVGFSYILESCKEFEIQNFIYASSSSVYGGNNKFPFQEDQKVDNPLSLYAATKVSNELMANAYSHLYKIPTTGLRFFTVYGPWGRPDMAPMIFAKSIFERRPIDVFNFGKMQRDFTYIDDIVEGIYRCCFKKPQLSNYLDSDSKKDNFLNVPHQIFNIGNSKPVELLHFINLLEVNIGIKAIKNFKEMQLGDVKKTFANTEKLNKWIDYSPSTSIDKGVELFIKWYREYYNY